MKKEDNKLSSEEIYCTKEMMVNQKIKEQPIWKKSLLTVVEASKYFQIGETNLRRITKEYRNKDFIVWKDSRVYIRREPFERFLDKINEI